MTEQAANRGPHHMNDLERPHDVRAACQNQRSVTLIVSPGRTG
jgi:hypothetical protein